MAIPCSRVSPAPSQAQVWSQRAADLRQQAIAVVAQMAFHLVKTQSECPQQEVREALTTHPSQTAPYPLDASRPGLRAPVHAHAGPR